MIAEHCEEVIHSNGSKTIYTKRIDNTRPKVERIFSQYYFNSDIIKIEHIPASQKKGR